MRREQIQVALEAAREISHHHEYVVAGSLSVLGFLDSPPELMSTSIDIDFYPLRDPGRAEMIAWALGENSKFHVDRGYYLDPIHPELPVLPQGWRERMVPIVMGTVIAYFLEVNDIAVSKYARSAPNDFRWLAAGYNAQILNIETIKARVRWSTTYPEEQDRININNGLAIHGAAMREDGTLAEDLLSFFDHATYSTVKQADSDDAEYTGRVVWSNGGRSVQFTGDGMMVIHQTEIPASDDTLTIRYSDGPARTLKFQRFQRTKTFNVKEPSQGLFSYQYHHTPHRDR